MTLISTFATLSVLLPAFGQAAPTGGGHQGQGGHGAGHVAPGTRPVAGGHGPVGNNIVPHGPFGPLGFGPQVNRVPPDVTGQTFSRPEPTFSRSYISSLPYLQPSATGAFPDSEFLPGALPPNSPWGMRPHWNNRVDGKQSGVWGPFQNSYQFAGFGNNQWGWGRMAGFYPYQGYYGYYPYGWGGDGTFVMVGDSALRAWSGEPVDGYPPQVYGGPMPFGGPAPWPGMTTAFGNQPALPEGMAFAQFTGEPEVIVLDFPPGARVRR